MKTSFRNIALAGVAALGLGFLATSEAHAQAVALELSLVIDVSGSVNSTEYDLQRKGYQAAFQDAGVQAGILSFAGSGGVAVNVIQFSSNAQQAIGWTVLNSVADINTFASTIGTMARIGSGIVGTSTDVEDGMSLGLSSILGNTYTGARKVIDVSGDGIQNIDPACSESAPFNSTCAAVQAVRNSAAASGVRINGLAIEGDFGVNGLTTWYDTNVRTADGFVQTATGFNTFEAAVTAKIGREITDTPEPATMAILGMGLLGLGIARRRKAS